MRRIPLGRPCALLVFLVIAGCSDDESHDAEIRARALVFLDQHWSEWHLVAAYTPEYIDAERSGEGAIYFPEVGAIADTTEFWKLPLWIYRDEDEREYMENAGKWDQFIFGWDDYQRASVSRPEYDHEPTYTIEDLRQPWVSRNREQYRQILAGN